MPVDRKTAGDINAYQLNSHTYLYHATYGSDEIQRKPLTVRSAKVSDDGMRVRLVVSDLRELFVHEIIASGVRNTSGDPLLHPYAWYTLNHLPK